ncbi:MAG: (Fe-S)-binding protein [Hyphomicrobiales bacterium]|nr:(Fe-S)-binding protein [Hyphomicrobiales bacterium]
MSDAIQRRRPRVALFVTCLVDMMRPSVGFAAVRLLERAGCEVSVPRAQTCCGQPGYNSGAKADAADIARGVIAAFEAYDYVVAPSGSCAGMLRKHYPMLLADDDAFAPRARSLSTKTHELIYFLTEVMRVTGVEAQYFGLVTYHDSCSSLREIGLKEQPRRLLYSVKGLELAEMEDTDVCCGFGGAFSVKYPSISNAMATQKADKAASTGASLVLGNDLGCLMNIAGKLSREGKPIQARHIAEVLAMETSAPPICAPRRKG